MATAEENKELTSISRLLQLESMARAANSKEALGFMIVNETRRLIPYRQAVLFLSKHPIRRDCEVVAASSVAIIENNSPYIEWLSKLKERILNSESVAKQQQVDKAMCPEDMQEGWQEFSLPFVLWTPLKLPDGTFIGGLWLTRETPWQDNEMALVKRLGETYAHAMVAVTSRRTLYQRPTIVKVAIWVILLFLVAVLAKPIQLTALAPAEVTAIEPKVVSAPMDGVVSEIYFSPNSYVSRGETLFSLEESNLQNEYNVVEKTLAVAEAELRKASQDAFQDAKSKAQISLLKAETDLQRTKLDYARELLDKIKVKAEKDGVLIYSDKSDWIGKPVQVGERIMEIADPSMIQLKVNLPIDDAIVLQRGAELDVFLDADPLNPIKAMVSSASYTVETSGQDTLSYRLYARFEEDQKQDKLRIGLQGTAKVYGDRVSLFFYLFRRPISALRQFLGI